MYLLRKLCSAQIMASSFVGNIVIADGKAVTKGKCTMCYRCFSHCPVKALTILGNQVYEQCCFENYQ